MVNVAGTIEYPKRKEEENLILVSPYTGKKSTLIAL